MGRRVTILLSKTKVNDVDLINIVNLRMSRFKKHQADYCTRGPYKRHIT